MQHFVIALLLNTFLIHVSSQTLITGRLTDESGKPLIGANIFILDTYEGTTSDTAGYFSLTSALEGEQLLVVKFIGYNDYSTSMNLAGGKLTFNIRLKESASDIDEVQITAGTFSAGDKKTSVMLSSMDIAMSASALGDINAAMSSLPGAQFVGEEGGLFVRGGDQYETRTFIDGLRVERPFTSKQPDLPVRSRFSPLLFSGTMFSTGGFSAEYGDALSGALILTTNAFPDEDKASVSVHSAGLGLNLAKIMNNTAFTSSTGYYNMAPYLKLAPQEIEWEKEPRTFEQTFTFRQRTGETGMIKSMLTFSDNQSSMQYRMFQDEKKQGIDMHNRNLFLKTSYSTLLNDKWMMNMGVGFTYDTDKMGIGNDDLNKDLDAQQVKINLTHYLTSSIEIKAGGEIIGKRFIQSYLQADSSFSFIWKNKNVEYASYVESNIQLSKNIALRMGTRLEYTDMIQQPKMVPRASMALRTSEKSQISLAYGIYNQKPSDELAIYDHSTGYETSQQYIANYQIRDGKRTFRLETYLKNYSNLITFDQSEYQTPINQKNDGKGYATGIDLFYRDKETVKNGDFWISWSLIDSKRLYRDYPDLRTPSYISTQNISVVYKQYLEPVRSFIGFSYRYASPRTYYHPTIPGTEYRTKSYNDFSVNALKIVNVGNSYGAIHLVVNNIFGFRNEYGYHISSTTNQKEQKISKIKPPADRFFLVGFIFIIQ